MRVLRSFFPIFFILTMSLSLLIAAERPENRVDLNDQDSSESTSTSVRSGNL